jgi:hypothetical protein
MTSGMCPAKTWIPTPVRKVISTEAEEEVAEEPGIRAAGAPSG